VTEEEQFRETIDRTINAVVSPLGIQSYDNQDILNYLQGLAKANGVEKMGDITLFHLLNLNTKRQKTASPIVSSSDIIRESVGRIVKTASAKALSESRTDLSLADVEYGFRIHYCTTYPFCPIK